MSLITLYFKRKKKKKKTKVMLVEAEFVNLWYQEGLLP